ncbi:MAG: CopD family protein [Gemmatimonadaceae bacterium]|nr:CopD family protein [Gemmatimonadaceae bacterium]
MSDWLRPLANLLHFAGLALAVGAVVLRFALVNRSGLTVTERGPAERDLAKYGFAGAIGVLLAVPSAALAQALGLAFPGDPLLPLLRQVLTTTDAGRAIALQGVWAAAMAFAFSVARLGPQRGWTFAAVTVTVSAIVVALRGHAAATDPRLPAQVATVLHVLGAGAWIGGLFHLWRIARKASEATLVRLLENFHGIALGGVTLVVASGLWHVWTLVDTPVELVTTGWGRLLVAKLVVLAGVARLGYRHWRGGEARVLAGDRAALRQSFARELQLAAVVFVLTAALTSTSPR